MNKIDKFLLKLSLKERLIAQEVLDLVKSRRFDKLNIRKLKGFDDCYRVRRVKIRIIFSMVEKEITIIKIDNRDNNTYKDL